MKIVADLEQMRKNLEARKEIFCNGEPWDEKLEEYRVDGQLECEMMERMIEEYESVEKRNLQMIAHLE